MKLKMTQDDGVQFDRLAREGRDDTHSPEKKTMLRNEMNAMSVTRGAKCQSWCTDS